MARVFSIAYLVALSIWVGGMVILALLVAPLTFRNLPSRAEAGALFGGFLRAFVYVELSCAAVCGVSLALLRFVPALRSRAPDAAAWVEAGVLGLMIVVALVHDGWIIPEARAAGRQMGSPDRPPRGSEEAARARFGRLHRASEILFGANMVLGLVLVGLAARHWT